MSIVSVVLQPFGVKAVTKYRPGSVIANSLVTTGAFKRSLVQENVVFSVWLKASELIRGSLQLIKSSLTCKSGAKKSELTKIVSLETQLLVSLVTERMYVPARSIAALVGLGLLMIVPPLQS